MKDMYSFDKDEASSKQTYSAPAFSSQSRPIGWSTQCASKRLPSQIVAASPRRRYAEVVAAYRAILGRLGVHFAMVEADMGNIGGTSSHEFHALAVRFPCTSTRSLWRLTPSWEHPRSHAGLARSCTAAERGRWHGVYPERGGG
jgi:prolyl-tRNA synthetase